MKEVEGIPPDERREETEAQRRKNRRRLAGRKLEATTAHVAIVCFSFAGAALLVMNQPALMGSEYIWIGAIGSVFSYGGLYFYWLGKDSPEPAEFYQERARNWEAAKRPEVIVVARAEAPTGPPPLPQDATEVIYEGELQLLREMELASNRSQVLLRRGMMLVVAGLALAGVGVTTFWILGDTRLMTILLIAGAYVQLIAASAWRLYSLANRDVHTYAARMIYCRQLMVATTLAKAEGGDMSAESRAAMAATRVAVLAQLEGLGTITMSPPPYGNQAWAPFKLRGKHGQTEGEVSAGSAPPSPPGPPSSPPSIE